MGLHTVAPALKASPIAQKPWFHVTEFIALQAHQQSFATTAVTTSASTQLVSVLLKK
jgi:N-acetyl-anhydromuramyl-L-alanine amidase AmpD